MRFQGESGHVKGLNHAEFPVGEGIVQSAVSATAGRIGFTAA
jgi:hypothetical protein